VAIHPLTGDILVVMEEQYVLIITDGGDYKQKVTLSYKSYGLFVDTRGYIYVTDDTGHAVHIYDRAWNTKQIFGKYGSCPGCFRNPRGIYVNNDNGDIIVADSSNKRVQMFSRQ
jgi:DNA-binding beta-propeller fold protein YncE